MIRNMIKNFRDKKTKAQGLFDEKAAKQQTVEEEKEKEAAQRNAECNWKVFYHECSKVIDLSGYWVGGYGSHGDEYIEVTQRGYEVQGVKLTGTVLRVFLFFFFLVVAFRLCILMRISIENRGPQCASRQDVLQGATDEGRQQG